MRSGLVPFDQPISRVWNYYAEMMHCIQITALIAFFGVLVYRAYSSVFHLLQCMHIMLVTALK